VLSLSSPPGLPSFRRPLLRIRAAPILLVRLLMLSVWSTSSRTSLSTAPPVAAPGSRSPVPASPPIWRRCSPPLHRALPAPPHLAAAFSHQTPASPCASVASLRSTACVTAGALFAAPPVAVLAIKLGDVSCLLSPFAAPLPPLPSPLTHPPLLLPGCVRPVRARPRR
jgi:hypothetical protein